MKGELIKIMSKKIDKYPNKADYEPNVDKHGKEDGELPLADPSESNETEVFRKNETKKSDENKPSAFSENKKR